MKYADFGTVSHGTMRPIDLIDAFADTLEYLVSINADEWCSDDGRAARDSYLAVVGDARELAIDEETRDYVDGDAAEWALEALFEALDSFAPPYAYFGAHMGDGSDYGFWLSDDWQREMSDDGVAIVGDLAELPDSHDGPCAIVNDHGNVTLGTMARGAFAEIWSIV